MAEKLGERPWPPTLLRPGQVLSLGPGTPNPRNQFPCLLKVVGARFLSLETETVLNTHTHTHTNIFNISIEKNENIVKL